MMEITQNDLEECFNEGYRAYYDDKDETYNPYEGMEAEWWSDGFEDATDESSGSYHCLITFCKT